MADAFQAGCLRARAHREAGSPETVVVLNTGGGLTGGDRLEQTVRWDAGAAATVTSQAAEKIYRAAEDVVRIDTRLSVAAKAEAEWLPQETILFDRARLDRRLEIDLDPAASFLGFEALILGRTAMGEVVTEGHIADRWRVRRGGRLIYADALSLCGPVDALMRRAAIGAGARAVAVILCVREGVGALLAPVREALSGASGRAAASAWNGLLAVRLMAENGRILKRDAALALAALRAGAPLPRVWTC